MPNDLFTRIKEEHDFEHWGVGCIIINELNQILVIRRSDNKQWSTPGGTVDAGETILEAVVREIKEEVGLDIIRPRYLGMCYTQQEKRGEIIIWNSYCFACRVYEGDIKVQLDEVDEYAWLSYEQCLQLNMFKAFEHSLYMMMEIPEYFELFTSGNNKVEKQTALEQTVSIHNPGTNGANGHYNSNGQWVYDKKKPSNTQSSTSSANNNPLNLNNIVKLKESFIQYFNKNKDIKSIYTVKDGNFVFPSCKQAIADGIVKNEQEYFTKFKEQYILYIVNTDKNNKID